MTILRFKIQNMNWGIVGLGRIAHHFVKDLAMIQEAQLYGVASRSLDKAQSFQKEYESDVAYGSYQELFDDPAIEIVYIATPHISHARLSIAAMQSGKHVLCEKPLGINAKEVKEITKVAEETGRFMMEAFWSRFNPTIVEVLARVRNGDLGDVTYVNADFSMARSDADEHRLLNPELGGGSILDVGVYPLFLTYSVLGFPNSIKSIGTLHSTGVDLQMASVLDYEHAVATVMSGFSAKSQMQAQIGGTRATILINPTWHEAELYTFIDNETQDKVIHKVEKIGRGYAHEVMECHRAIKSGKRQSTDWPLSSSLALLKMCDEIRKQIGVKYPEE